MTLQSLSLEPRQGIALKWVPRKRWKDWLRGVDLNHRPLGYEAKISWDAIQTQPCKSKGIIECPFPQLSPYGPLGTPFTDKKRTIQTRREIETVRCWVQAKNTKGFT